MTVRIYTEHGPDENELVYSGATEEVVFWLEHVCGADPNDPETALPITYKILVEGIERPMTAAMFLARQCEHEPNDCCGLCHDCAQFLEEWA